MWQPHSGAWGDACCSCARLWIHRGHSAQPPAKENEKPDYLKLNPNGRVPMIVHEGMPVWESAAITM